MSNEPDFLSVKDVRLLHEEQLTRYGGGAGVRDPAALDSAVAMPRATFDERFVHEDLFAMAAAYAFHIAQNQPFVDGNKRTALAAALVFLDLNGVMVADPAVRSRRARRRSARPMRKRWRRGSSSGGWRRCSADEPLCPAPGPA